LLSLLPRPASPRSQEKQGPRDACSLLASSLATVVRARCPAPPPLIVAPTALLTARNRRHAGCQKNVAYILLLYFSFDKTSVA
jgi:hypothetical protein